MRDDRRSAPLTGAIAGAFAGIAAAYAMDHFQAALSAAGAAPTGGGDPATVKVAQRLSSRPIPQKRKAAAGNAVHYAFGAVAGLIYGFGSELIPAMAAGRGMAYGVAVALLGDELAVPAAGLSAPASQFPPAVHAYSLASHIVFGATLDGVRRVMMSAR